MKLDRLRPCLRVLAPIGNPSTIGQTRWLHKTRPSHKIPEPRPFVPDVESFLTLIGRGMNKYASKFPSWKSLFSLTGVELKELGIEPPRNRRYLVQWLQRYRKGALGPGGDFTHVKDGEAILKIATPPAGSLKDRKWVVNIPHPETKQRMPKELVRPKGYTISGATKISGPYALPLPGGDSFVVKVTEGMWEQKRGRKIDGGERRRAEVQFKKRSAERRAAREAEILANL